MMKRLRGCVGFLILALGALLLTRTFIMRVYYVDSPSMEPGLHGSEAGGDHALVLFGGGESIKRGDVVVILPANETEPLVKRVAALPGEQVAIHDGDLWIDGRILRTESVLPMPIAIFDYGHQDLAVDFRVPGTWAKRTLGWTVDATKMGLEDMGACSFMRLGLKDHYLLPSGRRIPGLDSVGDALLECHLRIETQGFNMRVGLVENGDRFELLISPKSSDSKMLRLLRNGEELLSSERAWGPGTHNLRFANINNRLTFELDGERVFTQDYAKNTPLASDHVGLGLSPASDRVSLGGHDGVGRISGIKVFRDLHYSPIGEFAVGMPLQLGPHEIFLLGDNSSQSRDGREWGPTPLSEVIGRPLQLVWPPERFGPMSGSQSNWDWAD